MHSTFMPLANASRRSRRQAAISIRVTNFMACCQWRASMLAICQILHIPSTNNLIVEVLNAAITLEKGRQNSVFDSDGSAIIIHARRDDYKTDPTGDAGARIACGVIK